MCVSIQFNNELRVVCNWLPPKINSNDARINKTMVGTNTNLSIFLRAKINNPPHLFPGSKLPAVMFRRDCTKKSAIHGSSHEPPVQRQSRLNTNCLRKSLWINIQSLLYAVARISKILNKDKISLRKLKRLHHQSSLDSKNLIRI